jgi:predicted permease
VDLDPVDLWIPLATHPGGGEQGANWYRALGWGNVKPLARLYDRTQARALDQLLTAQFRRTNAGAPSFDTRSSIMTAPLLQARGPLGLGAQAERNLSLTIRLAGVGLAVLLIAAANVASLLLMRALRRRHEIAVRLALGVSRRRLLAQATVETMLLGILAGGVALLLAAWAGTALRTLLLSNIRWTTTVLDHRVVLAALVLAIVTALAAGLAPAALMLRGKVAAALAVGAAQAGGRGSVLRTGLLVTQAALCMALLAGAGVFVQSLRHATDVDLGFDADRLISVSVSGRSTSDAEFQEAIERLRGVPGVQAVAAAGFDLPPGSLGQTVWTAEGDTLRGDRRPSHNFVDPDYFTVAGLRLIAGRAFTRADGAAAEPVAVISESFAAALWPGGAVGQCFYGSWFYGSSSATCRRVIGVVTTLRWDVTEAAQPHFFAPRAQGPPDLTPHNLLVRTGARARLSDAANVYSVVRTTLGSRGGQLLARRVADRLEPLTRPWRVAATLFSLFGMLALGSAAAGIYGLISYEVTSRARELAVRLALGAAPARVVRHVIGGGLRVMVVGISVGAATALVASPVMASLLFETSAHDPWALAAAAITLALAAAGASIAATRRATHLDPVALLNAQ